MSSTERDPYSWAQRAEFCFRCGLDLTVHGKDWPIYMRIQAGYPSVILSLLSEGDLTYEEARRDLPGVQNLSAQEVDIAWANTANNSAVIPKGPTWLCRDCQGGLLKMIGEYLGWRRW